MRNAIIDKIESQNLKTDLPPLEIGDTVDVHTRIIEGEKERIQVFTGVIISKKGKGASEMITVRRIVANQGVERIFPVHSPKIARIEIVRHGRVRRAKLYYLRDRIGKARRLKERKAKLTGMSPDSYVQDPSAAGAAGETPTEMSMQDAQAPEAATKIAEDSEPVQEEAGRKE